MSTEAILARVRSDAHPGRAFTALPTGQACRREHT